MTFARPHVCARQWSRAHLGWALLACALGLGACSGRSPGTPDGRAPDGRVVDGGLDPDGGPYCPLDAPQTVEASGLTPLGTIHATRGWFGILGGECGGFRVVLVPDQATFELLLTQAPWLDALEPPAEALLLWPQNWDGDNGGWLNSGPVGVTEYRQGTTRDATGTITVTRADRPPVPLDPADPPRFEATFRVESPGWTVAGRLQVGYCAPLSVYCP